MTLLAAAVASPVAHAALCAAWCSRSGCCAPGFLVANPYALLDHHGVPRRAAEAVRARRATTAASSASPTSRLDLLPRRRSPGASAGCRALAALGGAVGADAARPAARAGARSRRRSCCSSSSASRSASSRAGCCRSTRSCCLLAAWRRDRARARGSAARVARSRSPCSPRCCALQGLVFTVHNDRVLAEADTRQLARDWMVANIPVGLEDRRRADRARPVGDGRRATRSSNRAGPATATAGTSGRRRARCFNNDERSRTGVGRVVKLEDYERTTRPELVERLRARRLLLGRDRLDAVRARVRGPAGGARRDPLLRRARARRRRLPRPARTEDAACRSPSTTRSTTTR